MTSAARVGGGVAGEPRGRPPHAPLGLRLDAGEREERLGGPRRERLERRERAVDLDRTRRDRSCARERTRSARHARLDLAAARVHEAHHQRLAHRERGVDGVGHLAEQGRGRLVERIARDEQPRRSTRATYASGSRGSASITCRSKRSAAA